MAALAARVAEKIAPKVRRFFPFVALGISGTILILRAEKTTSGVRWLQCIELLSQALTMSFLGMLTSMILNDLEPNPKNIDIMWFFSVFGCKRVNCDEMDGDRPRLPANRNCHRLSRVSWALAQISCLSYPVDSCVINLDSSCAHFKVQLL